MLYTDFNCYDGEPVRLYREPSEIRKDINEIKKRIDSVSEMLNIRQVISEVFDEAAFGDAGGWMCTLSELVADAEGALCELKELKSQLTGLHKEMEDSLWLLGT